MMVLAMANKPPRRTMPYETIGTRIAGLPSQVEVGRISGGGALHIVDPLTGESTCGWTRITTRRLRVERSIAPETLQWQYHYCRRCWERYTSMVQLLKRSA